MKILRGFLFFLPDSVTAQLSFQASEMHVNDGSGCRITLRLAGGIVISMLLAATLQSSLAGEARQTGNQTKSLTERFQAGESAAGIYGRSSDGGVCNLRTNCGSVVLLSYVRIDDRDYEKTLALLSEIFAKYEGCEDLKLVTIWADDVDEFMPEMNKRGFDFYNSRQWWKLFFAGPWQPEETSNSEPLQVYKAELAKKNLPFHVLLDAELRVIEAEIPEGRLAVAVQKALQAER